MPSYLGQNFLKDSTYTILIAQKVAQLCTDLKLEQCIEIWPGKWALTKKLIAIVDKPLVLLEKDQTLVPYLQQYLQSDAVDNQWEWSIERPVSSTPPWNHKIDLIMGDALALDTASLLEQKWRNPAQTIVVGNLPYYITSPLITKFFWWWNAKFPAGVFMVQKEVADKIRTDAAKKSFLWWLLNYQYTVKHIKTVPAKAFSPVPKVQSAIFSLIAKAQTPDFAYDDMVWLLDKISGYKRKTLGKSWKMAERNSEFRIQNSEWKSSRHPEQSEGSHEWQNDEMRKWKTTRHSDTEFIEVEESDEWQSDLLYISHWSKKFYLPKDLENKRLEEIGLEEMGRILS